MPKWVWKGKPQYRYRDSLGRLASQKTIWKWGDMSMDSGAAAVKPWATQLFDGTIGLGEWRDLMRQAIKEHVIQQYVLGTGGKDRLTPADYGSMGGMIAEQYRYLDGFVTRLAAGELSEAQTANYASMYILSAREAYERANGRARGLPDMPAYPADGSTICLTRDACRWDYHFRKGKWECFWKMDTARENCETCIERAGMWNPLILEPVG